MFFWDQHKTITSCYELFTRKVCDRYQLTQMEYDILMFLHNNPKHNTAADIVKIRKSTKSHVSTSLKALENKGLIERIQSARNKKHIEIVILNKAESIIEDGMKAQKEFAKNVLDGLTEEEKYMCMAVFNKICANADAYLKKYAEGENEKLFLLKYCSIPIIITAPNPYIAQNGPYKKLCLLSITPFVTSPNNVSIINPKML